MSLSSSEALPVFPFSDKQVQEVADALASKLHGTEDAERSTELAQCALAAAARVMSVEHKPDPNGYPTGYGFRSIRGVTHWAVVKPDGSWELLS